MINEPSVDTMIRKLGTDKEPVSRYALCSIASKRARQVLESNKNRGISTAGQDKELLTACKEIQAGTVVVAKE